MKSLLVIPLISALAIVGYLYSKKETNDPITQEGSMNTLTQSDMTATSLLSTPSVQTFNVTGKDYEFSLKEMRVKKGDTVRINFESVDGTHNWTLDEFEVATEQVAPGTLTSVEFIADTVGAFEYYSSIESDEANGMVGQLFVEE
jgi:plastocyanin